MSNYEILINKENKIAEDFYKNFELVEVFNVEEQKEILKEYIDIYGEEGAYMLAAIPGTSEHHTGLAIDITVRMSNGEFALTNEELYDEEEKFRIVHKYLKDYGFILRYHKGKEEITKYSYEPWHIRYIGERIAKICDEKDIVLEEYYQIQNM